MAKGKGQKVKKKVLITGANGMLGRALVEKLGERYAVKGITIDDADITDLDAIAKVITKIKPALVIHAAAYTKVDECESNISLAYRVNAIGTRNVAIACQGIDASMVYISTDYIFDGTKDSPYVEFDPANPLSIYGNSKLAGEVFVQQVLSRFYIIRTAWLYGEGGANFVDTIINKAKTEKQLKVVDDQRGSPTYTKDLADKIGEVISREGYGIYHITNSGSCSWFEFAKKIVEISLKKNRSYMTYKTSIVPIKSSELKRPAKRPANSVLRNFMLELEGISLMRHWEEALKSYLSNGDS